VTGKTIIFFSNLKQIKFFIFKQSLRRFTIFVVIIYLP
jgi:hypothetical protein